MSDSDYFIPQEQVERILPCFGITSPTPMYEHRLRPQGLRLSDLSGVLADSRFVFGMDWRAFLDEFVEGVLPTLKELGAALTYIPDNDQGGSGTLVAPDGRKEHVQYLKAGDDFDGVIRAFQRLVPPHIEFRASPANYPEADGWAYAVLPREDWEEVETIHGDAIRALFIPLPKSGQDG